jgi:hypothetical protein
MSNGVLWDVMPCGSCKIRNFGELSATVIRVTRIGEIGTTLPDARCEEIPWYLIPSCLTSAVDTESCKGQPNMLASEHSVSCHRVRTAEETVMLLRVMLIVWLLFMPKTRRIV